MKIELNRPIVFFDLETTGTDIQNDKIVQISLIKVNQDKTEEVKTLLINPGIPIPAEATEVHEITDEDVRDKPNFQHYAEEIHNFLLDCDISGYNIHRFDLPLIRFEFQRVGISYDIGNVKVIDPMVIYIKKNPRDLTSAYKQYCHKTLEGAHDAEVDTRATKEILFSQFEQYDDIGDTLDEIAQYSTYSSDRPADIAGKLLYNQEGALIYNFGKNKGSLVTDDLGYARWMINSDFPEDTKNLLSELF